MEVTLGKDGLGMSWQAEFPETTTCVHCGGEARIGFVAHEGLSETDKVVWPRDFVQYMVDLHENGGKGEYWFHDCAAVAIYFCKDCFEITGKWNQA